ncbi:MAG: hypothetical protein GFH27_549287n230 [Chloroflexi bacterium AL-W]|nr:hypothetical protein [Chloroflexi bacterium AL-N1]NOK66504.1 hypothetical protein [Chloroflexi bacterium AL-N10]NOK71892.1 hypothetical protein [Chloroflexi bacterium AL-N5]NOK81149.1 hypothetical protein [Chloroflexi bacterium AL-W]NOK89422.1 hypothetical protein [Chloroflexi bacterium AL-N15]
MDVAPGESWDNTATVTYASLPDEDGTDNNVPGNYGDEDGARDSSDGEGGAIDDYEVSDTTGLITVPDVKLVKQIEHPINTPVANVDTFVGGTYVDSTDDPNTGVSEHDADIIDLAIGEEFNYIITVTLPDGTTYNLTMIDLASPTIRWAGVKTA